MRQRTGRKRLCFLLPFALMLVLVMAVSAAAWAEPASAHTHTLGENTITFDPWESTNSLPYSEGSYYLTDNVTLSEQWQPASGTTNLCLNGHAIIFDKEDSERIDVICVANGTTLNLFDETANAGTITHAAGEGKCPGRGVFVYGGTFTVYGGTITGNNAAGDGGGVYVRSGTFNLSGGTVTGNNAGGDGGGVFLGDGILTVSGGSITGNNAGKSGGGVEVCGGTFNLSGGSITGNNAGKSGGGVEVYGGTFNLSGGSITGNNAGGDGGGVYMNRLRFNISGSPTITDNVKGGRIDTGSGVYVKGDNGIDSNVYLNNAASKKVINVVGTLTNTRPVGVTMAQPGVFTKSSDPVKASDYYDKFASDSSDYAVVKSDNELTLTQIIAYPLYVSGTQVTNANQYDVLGDADEGATVVYTPADNSTTPATPATLTLSGANITTGYEVKGSTAAIYTTDDLIVTGSGSVRNVGFGIHIEGGKTLTLNGDFDLTATVNGIYLFDNSELVMKDGTVNTTGGTKGVFASLNGSSVTIDGGTLTAIGNGAQNKDGYGLSVNGTLTVNGGMVFATGGTNGAPGHGIGVDPDAQASQIVINGGAVTATGARSALNKAPTVAEGITAFGSASSDGEPAEAYDAAKNSDYKWVRTQIDYPLWVGGTQVTSANRNDVLGDADDGATVVFTPADSGAATLTLSGASITDGYTFGMSNSVAAIYADGDLTINVTAASTVRGPNTVSGDSYGVYSSSGSVTVTGTGELNAAGGEATNGNSCGVWAFGDVTVAAAGKLTATGGTQGISGNVKNAIAGTGWTDVDGTQGEAAIAVSATGQDLSSYKKVQFPAVYPLWVGGTQVTSANQDDVLGDADQGATVTFAPADGADPATLTLTGANITTGHKVREWMNGIYYGGTNDLKLVLVGENKISGEDLDYGINNEGDYFKGRGALTVTGEGKLDVIGKYYGITSAKVLTIENATVYASATGWHPVCIQGTEGIVISNSTVKTTGENGIASNGSVVIKAGSNVMAAAQVYGIYSKPENNGSVVIEDGACVIATGNQLSAIVGNVKNAIAGTGWEDAFGVTGKEYIAVNTDPGGDLSKYRKVMFLAKPLITGADLVLDGTLDFRFYVALPENADPTGAYMSLTVHGRTIEIPFSEAEASKEGATQGQKIFPCPVYSIEMMEPVTAVFHYTQDGQAKTETLTASIKDYLDIAQGTYPAHPPLQDLIAAVRDYGHYIQLYLARLHGFTVGEGGEYAAMPAATEDLKPATAQDLEPYKTKWYRSNTVILDSVSYYNTFAERTTLHVRVKLKSARTLTATVNDKPWEITSLGGNVYDIEIPNIAANNLDEEYKVVFTADGVLVCDIGVSALTYVSAVLASDRDEADEKAALTAFYNYYKAAEAFGS